ncbi:MAG TPA: signal peptide peptidase SppA [Acidobacteriaceae bacterium]|nr:signal peptide peptidase SppA [Acidobacteriaceae bacterium]
MPAPPPPEPSAGVEATPPPPPSSAAPPPYAYAPSFGGYAPRQAYGYAQPPAYGQPPKKRRSPWFWVAILGGSFAVIALLITAMVWSIVRSFSGSNSAGLDGFGSKIGVIDIDGVITDPDKIDDALRKFGQDSSIKAIVLHIDSPGGGAAASQEVYHEVVRVRQQTHKPVVASVESVGASGAYYIASGCDKIYANDASVVGSIGVIMEWTNYGDLMKWVKLKSVVIHAGTLKDAGDPTRDMTPEEQAYFQSLVDNMYGQFVHDVAVGRHTTEDKIRPLATGQVWTGQQAIDPKLGLIDKIGGYREALIDTARQVGISGEPQIARPPDRKGLFATLSDDSDTLFPNPSKLLDQAPGFYFMWR